MDAQFELTVLMTPQGGGRVHLHVAALWRRPDGHTEPCENPAPMLAALDQGRQALLDAINPTKAPRIVTGVSLVPANGGEPH